MGHESGGRALVWLGSYSGAKCKAPAASGKWSSEETDRGPSLSSVNIKLPTVLDVQGRTNIDALIFPESLILFVEGKIIWPSLWQTVKKYFCSSFIQE